MELKVIPFEYCTLDRAAKFFSCEIEDFFHWYETKKISLCLKLNDHRSTVLSIDNKNIEFLTEFLGSDHIEYDVMASAKNEFSYIDDDSVFVGNRLSYDHLGKVYRVSGYTHDFWIPCDPVIQEIRRGGRITGDFSAWPYRCNRDFRVMVEVQEHYQSSDPASPLVYFIPEFTINELVLHKNDLNIINHLICGLEYKTNENARVTLAVNEAMSVSDEVEEESLEWSDFSSKETSLKLIAGMALSLSKSSPKFRNGSKINKSAIAKEAVNKVIEQGIEFNITERQLTNLMNQALAEYLPKPQG